MSTCIDCGYEVEPGAGACPRCAAPLDAPGPEPSAGPADGPEGAGVAWEDPGLAFPADLFRTWRESLFDPGAFFRRVPWAGPLPRPVLYYLLVTVVAALFTLWWSALGIGFTPPVGLTGGEPVGGSRSAEALLQFFATPFVALFSLLLWTLVLHLLVLLLVPAERRRGPTATARALCYASGPTIFSAVPFLGTLVGMVWSVVLQVVGLREAHRTTTGRAVAIVLLPLATAVAIMAALFVFVVAVLGITALQVFGG